jgi:glycosyltransferase involved in cell wall biosynthesis
MARVSVIIPTYNRDNFIRSAIISVLNQTYQDYDIVIVDDGSTDNTELVVNSFSCSKIKYIRHKKNMGEAESRNTGITNSNSEFIAFIDDDDEWMPDKLELQIKLMSQCEVQIGGIYTGVLTIDMESGKIVDKLIPHKRGYIYNDLLVENCVFTPSTILLKVECFKKVGLFDRTIKYGPDYDMWVRISKEYHYEYIKEPLVKYYIHKNKLSGNYPKYIEGAEEILKKYGEVLSKHKMAHSRHLFELGLAYCECDMALKGRKALMKAIYLYPWERRYYTNFCLSLLGSKIFHQVKKLKRRIISLGS